MEEARQNGVTGDLPLLGSSNTGGKINIRKEEEAAAMSARRLLVMEEVFGTLRFLGSLLF